MGDLIKIEPHTKVINLKNYDQRQLLEFLRKIVDACQLYTVAQECIITEFPGFKKLRLPNIKSLKLIADEVDDHHSNFKVAKAVGRGAQIAGSIAAVGGLAVATVLTGGLVAPAFVAVAGGIAASGGMISLGTLITEGIIQKVELKKIEKLLLEDKDYFERVFPFVQRTSELTAAIENLINYNVFHNMMESFVNNPDVVNAMREERPMQHLPQGMEDFINDLPINANENSK